MKLKHISLLLLTAIVFCCLSSCLKKGEDDPLFSLRTRKARVVGKWKIESGIVETIGELYDAVTGEPIDKSSITYLQSSYQTKREGPNINEVSTGDLSYEMEFKKNGEFISTAVYDNTSTTILKGTWNFTGKIGERKNKEQILIHFTSQSYNATGPYSVNNNTTTSEGGKIDITYDLKELRNKKMVLVAEFSSTDQSGNTYSNTTNLTFIQ